MPILSQCEKVEWDIKDKIQQVLLLLEFWTRENGH